MRESIHDMGASNFSTSSLRDGLSHLLDLRAGDQEGNVKRVVTEGLVLSVNGVVQDRHGDAIPSRQ